MVSLKLIVVILICCYVLPLIKSKDKFKVANIENIDIDIAHDSQRYRLYYDAVDCLHNSPGQWFV